MEKNTFLRAFYLISSVQNKVGVTMENLFFCVTHINLDVNKVSRSEHRGNLLEEVWRHTVNCHGGTRRLFTPGNRFISLFPVNFLLCPPHRSWWSSAHSCLLRRNWPRRTTSSCCSVPSPPGAPPITCPGGEAPGRCSPPSLDTASASTWSNTYTVRPRGRACVGHLCMYVCCGQTECLQMSKCVHNPQLAEKECLGTCVQNMQQSDDLSPLEIVEMFAGLSCFLKDSSDVSQTLLDDFRMCQGYAFLCDLMLR